MSIQVYRAYQGNDEVFTASLSSPLPFAGTEGLTTIVTRGDTQAAVATLDTTWNDPTVPSIDIALPGSTSALLKPDSYMLLASQTGTTPMFVVGVLQIFPNAGGAGGIRSLCTVPQALIMAPELLTYQSHFDQLPATLEQATTACENYCNRKLLLTSFDRLYSRPPVGWREVFLDARPVATITALTYGGLDVTNYTLDGQEGVITLAWNWRPAFASGWDETTIRAVYRAGYAYLQADLALGYEAVPADLKRACAMVANAMMSETDFVGPVFGQSINRSGVSQSYQLRGDTSVIPKSAQVILDGYGEANRGVF